MPYVASNDCVARVAILANTYFDIPGRLLKFSIVVYCILYPIPGTSISHEAVTYNIFSLLAMQQRRPTFSIVLESSIIVLRMQMGLTQGVTAVVSRSISISIFRLY